MKKWGMIILLCLAIVGCGSVNNANDFKVGDTVYVFGSSYLADGLYLISESDGLGPMPYKINGFWLYRENVTFAIQGLKQAFKRIEELEQGQAKNRDIWKLANTHEIKQDEKIAGLEYQIELSNEIRKSDNEDYDRWMKENYNKLFDKFWENRELISLLMDHLNLEEKFISEHIELKEKAK